MTITNEQRAHDLVISLMPVLIERSKKKNPNIGRVQIYVDNYKEVLTKMNDLLPEK